MNHALRQTAIGLCFFMGLIFVMAAYRPAAVDILGSSATPETIAVFEAEMGFNQTFLGRFGDTVRNALIGDFGVSFVNGRPVAHLVSERLGPSVTLLSFAALVAVPMSLLVGHLYYRADARWRNLLLPTLTTAGYCVPAFAGGLVLVFVFAVNLGWLPSLSNGARDGQSLFGASALISLALPVTTIAFFVLGPLIRATADQVSETHAIGFSGKASIPTPSFPNFHCSGALSRTGRAGSGAS